MRLIFTATLYAATTLLISGCTLVRSVVVVNMSSYSISVKLTWQYQPAVHPKGEPVQEMTKSETVAMRDFERIDIQSLPTTVDVSLGPSKSFARDLSWDDIDGDFSVLEVRDSGLLLRQPTAWERARFDWPRNLLGALCFGVVLWPFFAYFRQLAKQRRKREQVF